MLQALRRWISLTVWRAPSIGSIFDRFVPGRMVCPSHGTYDAHFGECPMCDAEAEHFVQTGRWN